MLRFRPMTIFKDWLSDYVFLQKIDIFHCKNFVRKLQWCVKMANLNVNDIKRLILLSFFLFIKINVNSPPCEIVIKTKKVIYLCHYIMYRRRRFRNIAVAFLSLCSISKYWDYEVGNACPHMSRYVEYRVTSMRDLFYCYKNWSNRIHISQMRE